MSIDDYLPDNIPKENPPYALKLKLNSDEGIVDALEAFNGIGKKSHNDDSNNILAVDAYGVINGGIDYLETVVDNNTFFEPANTYSVYPGTGIRKDELDYQRNHQPVDIMKTLNWSTRDHLFHELLGVVDDREDLDNDNLYYLTDIAAFDTRINVERAEDIAQQDELRSVPENTPFTIPLMRHERVQAFNGYTVFLDWDESEELDQLKLDEFKLDKWTP